MAYNPKEIDRLAKRFIEGDEESWNSLIQNHLMSIIDIQLAKKYKGYPGWDDLKQEVLLMLWEKREKLRKHLKRSKFSPYKYLWEWIRQALHNALDKEKSVPGGITGLRRTDIPKGKKPCETNKPYSADDVDVKGFPDLSPSEKSKLGLEDEEDE